MAVHQLASEPAELLRCSSGPYSLHCLLTNTVSVVLLDGKSAAMLTCPQHNVLDVMVANA